MDSLEFDEREAVDAAIETDPSIRKRLDDLRASFASLLDTAEYEIIEPRGDLADLTLQAIHDEDRKAQLNEPSRWAQFCKATSFFSRSNSNEWAGRTGLFRNAMELSVLAVCVLIFGTIIVSNTQLARDQARQQHCGYQLAKLGMAIQDFAFHGRRQVAPELEPEGRLAFAGVYAARLNDRMLLSDEDSVWCPGSCGNSSDTTIRTVATIPSIKQLLAANLNEFESWRRWVGGSYAYSLGVIKNGQYGMPRYLSRPDFAILADAPELIDGQLHWNAHGAKRCNILFEDGRVWLQVVGSDSSTVDHPFVNEDGILKAGCNENDSVLGQSFFGPWGNF
jgi:hypothetical protein